MVAATEAMHVLEASKAAAKKAEGTDQCVSWLCVSLAPCGGGGDGVDTQHHRPSPFLLFLLCLLRL